MFNTEKEFIDYTIDEATWFSLSTGEIPTMEKWGFTKIVYDVTTNEYGKEDELIHWEADMKTCLTFWNDVPPEKWEVEIN